MELQLIAVVLLSVVLCFGGAISYISRRDRGGRSQTPERPVETPGHVETSHPPALEVDPRPHPSTGPPALRPGSIQSAPASPRGAGPMEAQEGQEGHHAPPRVAGEAQVVLDALRANQAAMRDPRLSTLDRVQALMSSPAFALHLTEQTADPPADD